MVKLEAVLAVALWGGAVVVGNAAMVIEREGDDGGDLAF